MEIIILSIIVIAVIIALEDGEMLINYFNYKNSIFILIVIFLSFYVVLKKLTKFLTEKFSNREFSIDHVFKRFQTLTSCLIGFAVG